MDKVSDVLVGLMKSWTAWLGALIVAWPDISNALSEHISALVGEDANNTIMRIMGILVILVRLKTTQSIAEKGMVK